MDANPQSKSTPVYELSAITAKILKYSTQKLYNAIANPDLSILTDGAVFAEKAIITMLISCNASVSTLAATINISSMENANACQDLLSSKTFAKDVPPTKHTILNTTPADVLKDTPSSTDHALTSLAPN